VVQRKHHGSCYYCRHSNWHKTIGTQPTIIASCRLIPTTSQSPAPPPGC
jgi:hypothetical protein